MEQLITNSRKRPMKKNCFEIALKTPIQKSKFCTPPFLALAKTIRRKITTTIFKLLFKNCSDRLSALAALTSASFFNDT